MRNILDFSPSCKAKSPTEFCGPCPSCGGRDRFTLWPKEGPTGRYYCRGCGASGDGVQFLRTFKGMTYPEACETLGVPTKDKRTFHKATASQVKPTRPKEAQAELPPEKWTNAATVFLSGCQGELLKNPEAVATVCGERFIGQRVAIEAGLGWNDRDRYFMREAWELPLLQGREKIIVPRGIVISTKRNGQVIGLTVRCTDDRPKDRPRYWQVAGSSQMPFVIGETVQPVVLLESALDAVLVRQESENTLAAVGTMGSTKDMDQATADFIAQAPLIICTPDADQAGLKAWKRWSETFPKSVRILPIGAKDLTDMHRLATLQHMRAEQRTAPFVGEWLRIALGIARN